MSALSGYPANLPDLSALKPPGGNAQSGRDGAERVRVPGTRGVAGGVLSQAARRQTGREGDKAREDEFYNRPLEPRPFLLSDDDRDLDPRKGKERDGAR